MYIEKDFQEIKGRFSKFIGESFRLGQEEAIRFADESEKPTSVVVAPTGTGKSLVGMLVGACHSRFSYLCSSKSLQYQLVEDYPEARYMMGRNNFRCDLDKSQTAAECMHTNNTPCRVKSRCSYDSHKRSVLAHPIQILNYQYLLYEGNYVGRFSNYSIVICDEADQLESLITSFVELKISRRMLRTLRLFPPQYRTTTTQDGVLRWQAWADTVENKIAKRVDLLGNYISCLQPDDELTADDHQKIEEFKYLSAFLHKLNIFINHVDESWLFQEIGDGWSFQPTWLTPKLSQQYFFRHGEKFVLMSATMPPRAVLSQTLGLNTGDISYHEAPSLFPAANRPIILDPVADMSFKTFEDELPKLVKRISRIIDSHPGEKGLIHTCSWRLNEAIMSLNNPRLISHNSYDKMINLDVFRRSSDKIFVSPSSMRGVDLPDEACRFIIIAKAPFQSLVDKLVSARVHGSGLGAYWYRSMCAMDIVQASGRGVRHAGDHCVTYILDKQAEKLVVDDQQLFPRYWLDAVDYS